MKSFTTAAILFVSALGQNQAGKCDKVFPLSFPFEATRYMGTWYSIQHSSGSSFQPDFFDCTTAHYSGLNAEAGTFKVYNSSIISFFPRYGVSGSAIIANQPNGQAIVSFSGPRDDKPNYKILDTDYDKYSIVYSCEETKNSIPKLWILSRTPIMDSILLYELTTKLKYQLPNYDWSIVNIDKQGD